MNRPRMRTVALAAAATAGVLAAAGCGTGGYFESGNKAAGKTAFVASCGGCHTLKAAGTSGAMGPNLDQAFGYMRQQGYKEETIRQVVATQIKYAQGAMPANLVTGQTVTDVADYVASVAGLPQGTNSDGSPNYDYLGETAVHPAPPMVTEPGKKPTEEELAKGKKIFTDAGCAACHTLAAANATGTVGYNLDALKPEKQTVAQMVTIGGGAMPSFSGQLSAADIDLVAEYVSQVAGQGKAGWESAQAGVTNAHKVTAPPAKVGSSGGGSASSGSASSGGSSSGSTADAATIAAGKKVFASAGCSACHTLKDASATGTVGPNLDELKPDAQRVAKQVEKGGGPMPAFKGQLTQQQIDAVAAYVAAVAGK